MLISSLEQVARLSKEPFRAKVHFTDDRVENRRVVRHNRGFAIYAKNSRTRGTIYHGFNDDVVGFEPAVTKEKDPALEWMRSWQKVVDMLEESGLWSDLKTTIRSALDIGYDAITRAYTSYWEDPREGQVERIQAIDTRLIGKSEEGSEYVDTEIVWGMCAPAKIKKMNFGKTYNDYYLKQIAVALRNKTQYKTPRIQAGYDVHFGYEPERGKAWYSEEYRGCGNGHYYLALNATHALFYEDD